MTHPVLDAKKLVRLIFLSFCAVCVLNSVSFAQGQRPGMPIFPPQKAPDIPQNPTNTGNSAENTPKTEEKPTELAGITKNDYKIYLKSGHRSPKWDELIEPAFTAFDSDNLATASIFLQKAYELGCRDPLVLYRLAIYAESRGDTLKSAELFNTTVEEITKRHQTHPLAKTINKQAATALYRLGKNELALTRIQKAIESEPDDFMLLFMAGQLSRMANDNETALTHFTRAEKNLTPELGTQAPISLYREITNLVCIKKDLEACKAYTEKLEKASPNDPIAQHARQQLSDHELKQKEKQLIDYLKK